MTDRIRYLTVALDKDIRTDDVQVVMDAIGMIKCVHKVERGEAIGSNEYFVAEKILYDVQGEINELFAEKRKRRS